MLDERLPQDVLRDLVAPAPEAGRQGLPASRMAQSAGITTKKIPIGGRYDRKY